MTTEQNKNDFQCPRYMDSPCAACGRVLIEYCGKEMIYCYNEHIEDKSYRFVYMDRRYNRLPVYKCYPCIIKRRRVNTKKHLAICTKGYHAEQECKDGGKCKNWKHYTMMD